MSELLDRLWSLAAGGLNSWYEAKLTIEQASAISNDALHVVAGMLVWLLAALMLRTRLSAWLPWLIVAGLTLFNETVDLWVERWPDLAMQYGESGKDIVLTMLLPSLLLVLVRTQPQLFASRRIRRSRTRSAGRSR